MTYYYKVVALDLDAERARIKKVRYSAKEKAMLRRLCDLLEKHDVPAAVRMTAKWGRYMREYIGSDLWKILFDSVIDSTPMGRVELEKAWKKRDKKGLAT